MGLGEKTLLLLTLGIWSIAADPTLLSHAPTLSQVQLIDCRMVYLIFDKPIANPKLHGISITDDEGNTIEIMSHGMTSPVPSPAVSFHTVAPFSSQRSYSLRYQASIGGLYSSDGGAVASFDAVPDPSMCGGPPFEGVSMDEDQPRYAISSRHISPHH